MPTTEFMTSFSEFDLEPRVLSAVTDAGYTTPTPIQAETIPYALKGRDVLGIAQTGTGKTASFALPTVSALVNGRARARMPRSLVLCPTRELAAQVAEAVETYSKYANLSMALLIGGVRFEGQDQLIDKGVDILIATPGRLLDHFERGRLLLTGVQIMVVDEADRMLDMGFIPDIEKIFRLTPFTRQTLFFSATMAPEIERITSEFLQNPARVEVAPQATTSENTTQSVCVFKPGHRSRSAKEKRIVLRSLISDQGDELTNGIVFCNRKTDVDIVAKSLKVHGFDAKPIHGDLDQSHRTRVLDEFRQGQVKLLVASDVAARGLDIPNVSHIFNYDVPNNAENYVHRIGRTGRAGRNGSALMISLTPTDNAALAAIEELINLKVSRIDMPDSAREEISGLSGSGRGPSRAKSTKGRTSRPEREQKSEQAANQEASPRTRRNQRSKGKKPSAKPAPASASHDADNKASVVGMGQHLPDFMKEPFGSSRTNVEPGPPN